ESPEEIATRTLQLLRSPELAARLGAQGRARVEREFNWAVTARRLLELMTS
ncbi:MAG: glycosyltransferase family 4 protein, partial [Acidobacteria bacterium]|nr:glycosyltransferase family 4 protein [Acidobacteriota bacterium]